MVTVVGILPAADGAGHSAPSIYAGKTSRGVGGVAATGDAVPIGKNPEPSVSSPASKTRFEFRSSF